MKIRCKVAHMLGAGFGILVLLGLVIGIAVSIDVRTDGGDDGPGSL